MILLCAAGGFLGANKLRGYKTETERLRQTWIESATTDLAASAPKIEATPGRETLDVVVGIRVNRIGEFSLRESIWVADFNIWFCWSGDSVSPGENFQVVNGDIDFREREEALTEGSEHYERFNVWARPAFNLDSGRFPFSDPAMTIQIEDGADSAEKLRRVPDERDGGISPLGVPASMKVIRTLAAVKLHVYRSPQDLELIRWARSWGASFRNLSAPNWTKVQLKYRD